MQYDRRGRQTSLADPDAGSYSYQYNGAGEQTQQSDARGYVTRTGYDPLGRKATRSETQASGVNAVTTWSYDCVNGKGLLCAVSYTTGVAANSVSKTTTYDAYARPTATSTVIAGTQFVSQIAYDNLGRPQYAVYPQASAAAAPLALRTRYNSAGYAYQIDNASTGFVYQSISRRNADGQINQATLGGGLLMQTNLYSERKMASETINRATPSEKQFLGKAQNVTPLISR